MEEDENMGNRNSSFFFIKESRKKFTKFELLLLYKKMVF